MAKPHEEDRCGGWHVRTEMRIFWVREIQMITKAVVSNRKNEWRRDSGKRCDVQNGLLLQVSVKRPREGQRVRS
jgi:hypothetical protein